MVGDDVLGEQKGEDGGWCRSLKKKKKAEDTNGTMISIMRQ